MVFRVRLEATGDGGYVATCDEPQAHARGLSPNNALDRLRAEIRYRLELCPCSGVEEDYIQLEVKY